LKQAYESRLQVPNHVLLISTVLSHDEHERRVEVGKTEYKRWRNCYRVTKREIEVISLKVAPVRPSSRQLLPIVFALGIGRGIQVRKRRKMDE
jgi:hypothetical protein